MMPTAFIPSDKVLWEFDYKLTFASNKIFTVDNSNYRVS